MTILSSLFTGTAVSMESLALEGRRDFSHGSVSSLREGSYAGTGSAAGSSSPPAATRSNPLARSGLTRGPTS